MNPLGRWFTKHNIHDDCQDLIKKENHYHQDELMNTSFQVTSCNCSFRKTIFILLTSPTRAHNTVRLVRSRVCNNFLLEGITTDTPFRQNLEK